MSIRVMSTVWSESRASGGELLVLLALADFAHDNGVAFPSVQTLARKARLSERQTQRALASLVKKGELKVKKGAGPSGTNLYRVLLAVSLAGGDTGGFEMVTPASPDPSGIRQKNQALVGDDRVSPPREKSRDAIWDTLTEIFGEPATHGAKSLRGKMVKSFKAAGATPQEIKARSIRYARVMPPGTLLTETALEKHWPLLASPTIKTPPCPDCEMGGGLHQADCPRVAA